MYAVVRTGGKQHVVSEGDTLLVERVSGEAGDSVELGDVVLFVGDKGAVADKDKLSKVKVHATIVEQLKDRKVLVFKYKPKKRYRRKRGHRQEVTRLAIDFIDDGSGRKPAKPKAKAEPKAKPAPKVKREVKAATKPKPAAAAATAKEKKPAPAKPKPEAKIAKPTAKKAATEKPSVKKGSSESKEAAGAGKASGAKAQAKPKAKPAAKKSEK